MRELNVVISGFDHYDGVEVNPAVEVPKAIAEQGLGVSSAPDDTDAAVPIAKKSIAPLLLGCAGAAIVLAVALSLFLTKKKK